MFLAALLNAHMQPVKGDEHVVIVDQSLDDQAIAAEHLAHLRPQSFTPFSSEDHVSPASLDTQGMRPRQV
jgi:hypothetical protein